MKNNFLTLHYDPTAIASYVGAGTGLLGDIFNLFGSSAANREQRDYNTQVINQQRQWALQDIRDQNQYNSPAEQMNRLKQAGLNPHMVYGTGVTASTGQQQQQTKSVSIPSYNPVNIMGAFADMGRQMAQAISQLSMIRPTVANIEQSTATARANELNTKAETALKEFQDKLNQKYGDSNALAENRIRNSQMWEAQDKSEMASIDNYIKQQTKDVTIKQAAENYLKTKLENESDPVRLKILEKQLDILKQTEKLNDLDIQSQSWDFNANSPIWQQILMKVLTFVLGHRGQ